jgi:hypothetical protein
MATPVVPTNVIVHSGKPLHHDLILEAGTSCYPGRTALRGTADLQAVVGTANGDVIGWFGYEQTSAPFKDGHTVNTIYVTGDEVPVLYGGGFIINARLANGQNVTKGARLCAAASGELTAAIAANITIASGSTTVTSDKAQPDEAVAGSVGAQGIPIAIAMQSVDASGGAADILVLSLI